MAHGLIAWLIIGGVSGWLAGKLIEGGGFGLVGDIVVGIVGAVVGGFLAHALHIHIGSGFIGSIVIATLGACTFLGILRLAKRG
jgi:uncharacterized membrane protein YeaQ/YmgE (transglycosylase-associated protein family)